MQAVRLNEKYTIEEYKEKMISEGWKVKDFSENPNPTDAYRRWRYRISKDHEINHSWLINHPFVWFYRPILKDGGQKDD